MEAPLFQEWYEKYGAQGFLPITMLTETLDEVPPNQTDLNTWADTYGQTFPVLSDDQGIVDSFSPRGSVSLPSLSLIGPGMEVIIADGEIEEEDVIAALANLP